MDFYKGQILTQPYDISNIHGFYIHFFNLKVRPVFSFIHLLESQGFIAFLDLQVVWVFIFFFFFQLERCYLRNTTRCLGNGYSCSPTPWFCSQQSRSLFLKLFMNSVCIGHTLDVQNLNLLSTCIEMVIVCCFRKPLVSGYYKLLSVSMKIANKLNYFQVRIKTCTSIGVMMFEIVKFCIRIFLTYSVCDFWRKATIGPKNESYSYAGCFFSLIQKFS